MKRKILGVVVVLVAAAGVFYFLQAEPKDAVSVVETQIGLLKAGDVSAAYDLTSSDYQTTTPLATFEEYINANPALKNNASYTFSSTETDSTGAILKGEFVAVDGTVQAIEYDIVREDDAWKIYRMNVEE